MNDDNGGDEKKGSEDNVGFIRNGSPIFFQTEGKSFSKHKLFQYYYEKRKPKMFSSHRLEVRAGSTKNCHSLYGLKIFFIYLWYSNKNSRIEKVSRSCLVLFLAKILS